MKKYRVVRRNPSSEEVVLFESPSASEAINWAINNTDPEKDAILIDCTHERRDCQTA